jgi:HlyD family secretion protein/epimerase transport system membrane fusion protein
MGKETHRPSGRLTVLSPAGLPAPPSTTAAAWPEAGDRRRAQETSMRRLGCLGTVVVLLFFGGAGAWAALAPLASASISPGKVIVDSQRKTVQHLEGGIIGQIHVADGSRVEAGDVLVDLDDTAVRSRLDELTGRYLALRAQEARLIAERDGRDVLIYPKDLMLDAAEAEAETLLTGQRHVFHTRREARKSEVDILNQKIAQYDDEIRGLQAQVDSETRQMALIQDELTGVVKLYKEGVAPKTRVLALQRTQAELEGSRGEHLAQISRAKQAIGEARLGIVDAKNRFLNTVVSDLQDTQEDLSAVRERLYEARDIVSRSQIRAPRAGTVVDLQYHTTGGVVPPGGRILDLVPADDTLIVEAQVPPEDIDVVHAGLPADIRLTAFDQRSTPTLTGKVTMVSADRLVEERSGNSYYKAMVTIDDTPARRTLDDRIYPGMGAEVMIVTGERTALDILLSPIQHSINRAFREN